MGLPLDQPVGRRDHDLGHAAHGHDLAVRAGRGRRQILGQFALHLAIDGRQQRGLGPIDEEVYEHQDHRKRKGHRGRVELQAQARDHLQHRLVGRLGIDAVQGQRDADDRAQKAEDGDRPHDQAKQAIAAVGQRGIAVGEILQLIAEAFGRTETQDIMHRRAEPAQIVFVLPMRRLAIQLRLQWSGKVPPAAVWPGIDRLSRAICPRPIAGLTTSASRSMSAAMPIENSSVSPYSTGWCVK